MEAFAARYALGPTRVQLQNKDPRGFEEFRRMLAEHSAVGSRNTQLGVQRERPSLYDLTDQMEALSDARPSCSPATRTGPASSRRSCSSRQSGPLPSPYWSNCGHAINIEDPDGFNRHLESFLAQVDAGRWPSRDPRAMIDSITGMR